MKAMILAAGRGERLRPLTTTTPKPLVKAGGKPLIQYHIEHLASIGVSEIVINTSWLGDKIESFLGDGSSFGVSIEWSREDTPLETGGGIRKAISLLGSEPFLLINADIWTDFSLRGLIEKSLPAEIDAHLILVPNPPHNAGGDFMLKSGSMVSIPVGENNTYTYSGISVLRPEIFVMHASLGEKFPLLDVLLGSILSSRVKAQINANIWWDVGTLSRLQELDDFIMKR